MDEGRRTTEQAVVEAARRGDPDSVRELWQSHRRWVAAVVLAHKPREAELEDLVQDVAASFVRSIGTLRDAAGLRPWLRTLAINTAHEAGRRATRRRRLLRAPAGEPADRAADAPEGAVRAEEARRALELARSIPDGYREPLILKCVRGMSYRQIGELLGLPETTIETRIARGRRMLRELVAGAPAADLRTGGTKP